MKTIRTTAIGLVASALTLGLFPATGTTQATDVVTWSYKGEVIESISFGSAGDCTQDPAWGTVDRPGEAYDFGQLVRGVPNMTSTGVCVTAQVGNGFTVTATNARGAQRVGCIDTCSEFKLGDTAEELVLRRPDLSYVGLAEGSSAEVYSVTDPVYNETTGMVFSMLLSPGTGDPVGKYEGGMIVLTAMAN